MILEDKQVFCAYLSEFLVFKKRKKKDEEKELPQIFCNQMGFYDLNAVMEVVSVRMLIAGEFLLLSMHLCCPMAFSSLRFSLPCALEGFLFVFHRFTT